MNQIAHYNTLSDDALRYILADASEAARCMRDIGDANAECKYLDQVNDATTVLYRRGR